MEKNMNELSTFYSRTSARQAKIFRDKYDTYIVKLYDVHEEENGLECIHSVRFPGRDSIYQAEIVAEDYVDYNEYFNLEKS